METAAALIEEEMRLRHPSGLPTAAPGAIMGADSASYQRKGHGLPDDVLLEMQLNTIRTPRSLARPGEGLPDAESAAERFHLLAGAMGESLARLGVPPAVRRPSLREAGFDINDFPGFVSPARSVSGSPQVSSPPYVSEDFAGLGEEGRGSPLVERAKGDSLNLPVYKEQSPPFATPRRPIEYGRLPRAATGRYPRGDPVISTTNEGRRARNTGTDPRANPVIENTEVPNKGQRVSSGNTGTDPRANPVNEIRNGGSQAQTRNTGNHGVHPVQEHNHEAFPPLPKHTELRIQPSPLSESLKEQLREEKRRAEVQAAIIQTDG